MNYRNPTEEEWNDYFEISRVHMPSVCPDFAPQSEEYCKKRKQGWKTCDDKRIQDVYFYTQVHNKDVPAFHLVVEDVCLISPKGSKKWFKGLVNLIHLDPEDRFMLTKEAVLRHLNNNRDASIIKIFVRDGDCPCCRAEREQQEKEEEPVEDPVEPTTEKRNRVEEMD